MRRKIQLIDDIGGTKAAHKWQQVRHYILSKVSEGGYAFGDAIPSENHICERVGMSRNTVRQAFQDLENEGIIYRVKGKGTFLAEPKRAKPNTRNELLGLVFPTIRRSLYASLTQGFDDALTLQKFQTLICQTNNDVNRQGNIILRLLHKGIDGIAMVPSTDNRTPAFQIELLLDNNIPVVLCHRTVEGMDVPVLYYDKEAVGRLAGRLLLEHGHKKIAYYGVYRYAVTEAHLKGLRETMSDYGLELEDSHILFGPEGETAQQDDLRDIALTHFVLEQKPTAVFCSDDDEAERLYWVCRKLNMRVPADISIVGFGDCHRNTFTRKFLSAVVIDEYAMGQKAAELLCAITSGALKMHNAERISLDMDIYRGNSVALL